MTSTRTTAFSLLAVILLNIVVFLPALFNIGRADQLPYLMETAELESFSDLLVYSWSYPRTRLLLSGDAHLFRPLFYAALAVGKHLFGYDFRWWQAAAVLLHLLVTGLLFCLLGLIRPGRRMAALAAAFFSTLYIASDMVVWHHISPYMLMVIGVLSAMLVLHRWLRGAGSPARQVCGMVVCLTLAGFVNEMALVWCFGFLAVMELTGRGKTERRQAWWLVCPVLICGAVNMWDYQLHAVGEGPALAVTWPGPAGLLTLCGQLVAVVILALALPFLPGLFAIYPDERYYAAVYYGRGFWGFCHDHAAVVVVNGLLLALLAVAGVLLVVRRGSRRTITCPPETRTLAALAGLCGFMGLSYAGAVVVLRTGRESLSYLAGSLYHFYPMSLFLGIGVYAFLTLAAPEDPGRRRWLRRMAVVILALGTVLNAVRLYGLNRQGQDRYELWGRYVREVEDFIERRKQEPGFSIALGRRAFDRPVRLRLGDPAEGKEIYGDAADFLFRRYIDQDHPKYLVTFSDPEGLRAEVRRPE